MKTAFFFLALLLCSCRSIVETEADGTGGAGGGAVPGGGETGSDEAGPGTAGGAVASGGASSDAAGAGAGGDTAAGGGTTGAGGGTAAGGDGGDGGDGGAGGGTCEWQGTFTVCFEPCGCELSAEEMNTKCEEDAPGFGHAIVCTAQPIPSTQMPFKACQTMSQAMTCSGAAYEWYCCEP